MGGIRDATTNASLSLGTMFRDSAVSSESFLQILFDAMDFCMFQPCPCVLRTASKKSECSMHKQLKLPASVARLVRQDLEGHLVVNALCIQGKSGCDQVHTYGNQ